MSDMETKTIFLTNFFHNNFSRQFFTTNVFFFNDESCPFFFFFRRRILWVDRPLLVLPVVCRHLFLPSFLFLSPGSLLLALTFKCCFLHRFVCFRDGQSTAHLSFVRMFSFSVAKSAPSSFDQFHPVKETLISFDHNRFQCNTFFFRTKSNSERRWNLFSLGHNRFQCHTCFFRPKSVSQRNPAFS